VAECTKDEDKQLLLMVITDYRGYDVSLPVERSGGDVARLRTAEGDLLIDEEKVGHLYFYSITTHNSMRTCVC